jgi:hypothetical protein
MICRLLEKASSEHRDEHDNNAVRRRGVPAARPSEPAALLVCSRTHFRLRMFTLSASGGGAPKVVVQYNKGLLVSSQPRSLVLSYFMLHKRVRGRSAAPRP